MAEPRAERLAHLLKIRATLAAAQTVTAVRADEPLPQEQRLPPEPCYLDDHSQCGCGPVRTPQPKETP